MSNELAIDGKEIVKRKGRAVQKANVQLPTDPESLIALAVSQGASIETLERLLTLRERLDKDRAEKAFREAMSNFQAECPVVIKKKRVLNKDGKSTRYKYAPLDDIVRTAQQFIAKNGLSYDIETVLNQETPTVTVTVKVFHISGHSKASVFSVPIDAEAYMNEPQKWASAQTFAKRYAFCNAFGILTGDSDDDGNIIGDPKADKIAEDEAIANKKKIETEAIEKMKGLSPETIEAFKALAYITKDSWKAAWKFAEARNWNDPVILKELNMLANK